MFTFRAMNTDVMVVAPRTDEEASAIRIAATFWSAECRFSRFLEDSELSRLNRARGPFKASDELFETLARARVYVEMTNGVFDPAVGGALRALGYDRSFACGALDRDSAGSRRAPGRFMDVALDRSSRSVEKPEHVHIDLGGMVKGMTVDDSSSFLGDSGVIDAGGDVALRGENVNGEAWLVDIEDPSDSVRVIATIAVSDAAVATSAANRRRWRLGTSFAHHLIDPRSQQPALTDLVQATVIASGAELAEVLAKTTFVLGEREGRRFLERQSGIGAVLVCRDGRISFVGDVDVREVNHG